MAAAVPASLISLTDGVTRSMLLTKLTGKGSIAFFSLALSIGGATALAVVVGLPRPNIQVVNSQRAAQTLPSPRNRPGSTARTNPTSVPTSG